MFIRSLSRLGLSIAFLLVLAQSAVPQEREQEKRVAAKDVPAVVIANFKAAYPKAAILGYASEIEDGKQFYEIESREGGTHRDVLYNPDGSVAEVEERINVSSLPADVLPAIKQKFPRAVITLAEKTVAGDTTTYEVHGRQGRKRFELKFDSQGKLLPGDR